MTAGVLSWLVNWEKVYIKAGILSEAEFNYLFPIISTQGIKMTVSEMKYQLWLKPSDGSDL